MSYVTIRTRNSTAQKSFLWLISMSTRYLRVLAEKTKVGINLRRLGGLKFL